MHYISLYTKYKVLFDDEDWVIFFIDILYSEENEDSAIISTYRHFVKTKHQLSEEYLKLYCNSLSDDPFFMKHYYFLLEMGEYANPRRQAQIYSKKYQEQIKLGKSEVFAHQYGDLMGEEKYDELYCYTYAHFYDLANQEGSYSSYADKLATYICNYYTSFDEYNNDKEFDFDYVLNHYSIPFK